MFEARKRYFLTLLAIGSMVAGSLSGAMVRKMDLPEICGNSDRIFRGIVRSATPGTVSAGGGELPTVTYRIEVVEAFQGSFETKGDKQMAELTMLGQIKGRTVGNLQSFSGLPELPQLTVGREYLLLATAESSIGLSTTVGLAQGCFLISGQGKNEVATDGIGNSRAYAGLADEIRAALQ